MAVGWISALKLVPWSSVIEATPQIVQSARRLLGATRKSAAQTLPPAVAQAPADSALQALAQRVAQLEQEQQDSAALIESLAEHNARLVQAVEALRLRSQRLLLAVGVLALLTAGLWVWR